MDKTQSRPQIQRDPPPLPPPTTRDEKGMRTLNIGYGRPGHLNECFTCHQTLIRFSALQKSTRSGQTVAWSLEWTSAAATAIGGAKNLGGANYKKKFSHCLLTPLMSMLLPSKMFNPPCQGGGGAFVLAREKKKPMWLLVMFK